MNLKPSTSLNHKHVEPRQTADAQLPVGSREGLLSLIADVFEHDKDPRCAMLGHIDPSALVGEREGRAEFQLCTRAIRFPLSNFLALGRGHARGATRAMLIDAIESAKRWQTGEWRIVAATTSETFRARGRRAPSGLSEHDQKAMFAKPDEKEQNMQRTKLVDQRDPVLVVHLALAEVSQVDPVQGQKNQKRSAWDTFVKTNGLLNHMPRQGREMRHEAIRIICDHYDVSEEATLPELTKAQVAKVHKLRGFGLTDEEVAGAMKVRESQVEAVPHADA
jgi:hypothetical protein